MAPIYNFQRLKGSAAIVMVPDPTAHLQRLSGVYYSQVRAALASMGRRSHVVAGFVRLCPSPLYLLWYGITKSSVKLYRSNKLLFCLFFFLLAWIADWCKSCQLDHNSFVIIISAGCDAQQHAWKLAKIQAAETSSFSSLHQLQTVTHRVRHSCFFKLFQIYKLKDGVWMHPCRVLGGGYTVLLLRRQNEDGAKLCSGVRHIDLLPQVMQEDAENILNWEILNYDCFFLITTKSGDEEIIRYFGIISFPVNNRIIGWDWNTLK